MKKNLFICFIFILNLFFISCTESKIIEFKFPDSMITDENITYKKDSLEVNFIENFWSFYNDFTVSYLSDVRSIDKKSFIINFDCVDLETKKEISRQRTVTKGEVFTLYSYPMFKVESEIHLKYYMQALKYEKKNMFNEYEVKIVDIDETKITLKVLNESLINDYSPHFYCYLEAKLNWDAYKTAEEMNARHRTSPFSYWSN